MARTKILACTCRNAGQDEIYGGRRRLHNQTAKTTANMIEWRCTVCGATRTSGQAPTTKKGTTK